MLFVCPWFICGCDDFAIEQAVLGGDGMELIQAKPMPEGISLTASLTFSAIDNAGETITKEETIFYSLIWQCTSCNYLETQEWIWGDGTDVYARYKQFLLEDPELNEDERFTEEDGTRSTYNPAREHIEDLDDWLGRYKNWNIKMTFVR